MATLVLIGKALLLALGLAGLFTTLAWWGGIFSIKVSEAGWYGDEQWDQQARKESRKKAAVFFSQCAVALWVLSAIVLALWQLNRGGGSVALWLVSCVAAAGLTWVAGSSGLLGRQPDPTYYDLKVEDEITVRAVATFIIVGIVVRIVLALL